MSGGVRYPTILAKRLIMSHSHWNATQHHVITKRRYLCSGNLAVKHICKRWERSHLSTSVTKETVKIKFIDRDGDAFTVNAEVGSNLMKVAHKHDIDLEGACDGTLSCCTCHLVVHPDWFDKLGSDPCEDEEDMLDMAYGLTETSRLGCQVKVTNTMSGLVVRIPPYEPQYT